MLRGNQADDSNFTLIEITKQHHTNSSHLIESEILHQDKHSKFTKAHKNRKILHKINGLELFLHAAFLDNRFHDTIVRILGMQCRDAPWTALNFACIIYEGEKEVGRTVAKRYFIDQTWPWWGNHYGVMIDCSFPKLTKVDSVSLISNNSRYRYDLILEDTTRVSKPEEFAVCVKPAYGNMQVSRLVEWFETFRLVGVTRFIIYDTDMQGPSRYVLDYYEGQGLLKVIKFPFSSAIRHNVKQLHPEITPGKIGALDQQSFLVAMQDCLYRFHNSFTHLLFVDLDEILLPSNNVKLPDLLKRLDSQYLSAAGYMFLTSWHFVEHGEVAEAPDFLYMQKHAIGTKPILNQPKSVIRTDRAVSVNFHSVLDVPEAGYSNEKMSNWHQTAYVLHFRGKCLHKFEEPTCKEMLNDTYSDLNLQGYRHTVMYNVKKILDFLDVGD